jgi:hypothetical protein
MLQTHFVRAATPKTAGLLALKRCADSMLSILSKCHNVLTSYYKKVCVNSISMLKIYVK